MQDKLDQLKTRLARVSDLTFSTFFLNWDQNVMMPPGGVRARADQSATLLGLAHQFFVDEEVGALLDDLSSHAAGLDPDSEEARLITVSQREYEKRVRMPQALVEDIQRTAAIARDAWKRARQGNNFGLFQPHLEQMVDLQIQKAKALRPDAANPYDALLDWFEPGLDYAAIDAVFSGLKPHLVELLAAISQRQDAVDDSVVRGHFDHDAQIAFSREVSEAIGYDYQRGRLDLSAHPFTSMTSRDDVRITTRVMEDFLPSCVMASIHEAGHAIHMQNISPTLYRSNIERAGLATAESQSRFYENLLGRSRAFWKVWYPRLQSHFPQLKGVAMEAFYKALNQSNPSLIRVEADEVTYGMHIMLRFELENELINGRMKVADLPREWNARMETYLGVTPPDDADGVLQDIHWSQGGWGYFPDYLLGSILSSQLWERMEKDHPGVVGEIEQGQYGTINQWLGQKIHRHGGKFTFLELAEKATGKPFTWEPYMAYLKGKYSEIYG